MSRNNIKNRNNNENSGNTPWYTMAFCFTGIDKCRDGGAFVNRQNVVFNAVAIISQSSKYPLQLAKDFVMPYSKEQLNYFRMVHIVVTIFSRALRKLFEEEWRRFHGSKWRDRKEDGEQFFLKESSLNRGRNRRALQTIRKGDSSQFDTSILCYCILHSDSVGAYLKNRDPRKYNEIHRLQVLRNKVCHVAPKDAEAKDGDFQSFCSETIACFRNLRLSTSDLKNVAKEKSFDTDEVVRLRAELTREQLAVGEYEQCFPGKLSTYAPEKIHRATVKYPKHYKLVMRTFTDAIYKLDWEEFKRQSQNFLCNQDWTTRLFVQIELAYGYNIRGESDEAMRLLNDTIANAWRAGENCSRILSRVMTRKSLKMMYEQKHCESRVLAEEAGSAVSTIESPEEEMISQIRIVECLLIEDVSLESKKERFFPVWNSVIEMCERNLDSIPRGPYYLKFVFAYKALLHLGFSKNGFDRCPSSVSDLDVAQRCVQRLEEPDLKTEFEDTYADAFRLICKSKIAFDKSKVADVAEIEVKTWQKEALSLYDKAAAACRSAKNNGISFKLSSLKEYLKNGQQSGN